MAYAQQTRHDAAQRPQYQQQQASYTSLQQPHSAEYEYAPADQGAGFYGGNRPGLPQQYSDAYGSTEGVPRHDRDIFQGADRGGYRDNGQYRERGHNGVERPLVQQPQQRPVEAGRTYSDPRTRGQPRSKSRPPERSRHEGANLQSQSNGHRDVQGYQQQYQPEQIPHNDSSAQVRSGHAYNDFTYSHQNGWETDQQYRPPVNTTKEYYEPQKNAVYQGQAYADGYDEQPQSNHAFAPVIPKTQHQEPPGSSSGQPPSISSKSKTSQPSKASTKRIVETPKSPDTISWDNPFPTFPMRLKEGVHSSSRGLDGSVATASLKDEQRHENNYDSRSQTASSKSSSYTIPQPQSIDEFISTPQKADRDAMQERPRTRENGNLVARIDQLKHPVVHGRHSEDNRLRPSIPIESALDSSYERSKTMPTAISEAAVKPRNRPRPPVQTDWQEPGPVAGYHGPEDRGWTPTSPVDPSQRRPCGQLGGRSGEKRPYGHAAIQNAAAQNQNQDGGQLHTPQDSLGDVFDDYYDAPPPQNDQPYAKAGQSEHRPHVTEDMPKFNDAAPDFEHTYGRGPTLDKHLQSQERRQEHLPPPVPPQVDSRQNQHNDPYAKGQVPRSRSQPNLKGRRSPRQQQDDGGFDFGVPGPSARPPATTPARGEYDSNAHGPTRFPNHNLRPIDREQHPSGQGYSGPMPAPAYRNGDRNVQPPTTGPPPVAYQVNRGSDRYRSPPQDGGMYGPPPMAHQDNTQPDRYRSPPLQGGQSRPGPAGPPRRPSPNDRNMGNGSLPILYQTNGRSPPLQDRRSPDGQMRSPGDRRPQAIDSTGAAPPPIKSLVNPDALPSHPAPVRAGLMDNSPVNQTQKPAPVRQYSTVPSPMQLSEPSQKSGSSRPPEGKRDSVPVTHQDLDRLKQVTARNPNDLAAQLALAKKTAEAAFVLVDEQADPRTRSRSREKYITDAQKIVKKLSGNGYMEATFYLADCYTRGTLGLESDTREAFKLYQNAAKTGHAQAAYRVAVCCEIGQEEGGGTSRDAVKAMQWYKRAATLGDTPAMYKMGIISLKGLLGQPRNPKEAIVWLKRAAERADKENPHALHELALLHEKPSSNDGVPKDEAYSKHLFIQAAKLGYKFSQYRLGSAYEYGLMGCSVDPRQSIAWYSKAAVQEEHQSELALSGWYLTGSEGILQQSDTEAYLWARKAALAGLAKAEYAMGYFTEVGIGVTANLEDAKRWYWKAASQNLPKARDRLEDLRKGGPTKQKERVSRSNMRKSSEGECIIM